MRKIVIAMVVIMLTLLSAISSTAQAASGALEIKIDSGTIYFRGENADFYLLTTYDGGRVDANISKVTLYHCKQGDLIPKIVVDLSTQVKQIGTGFFWVRYLIPGSAFLGTYTLVAEAIYTGTGAATLKSFMLSPTLIDQNSLVTNMWVNTEEIKADLNAIGPVVTAIAENVTNIKTDTGTINARLLEVKNGIATLETDFGTIMVHLAGMETAIAAVDGNVTIIKTDVGTIKVEVAAVKGISTDAKTAATHAEVSATDARVAAEGAQSTVSNMAMVNNIVLITVIVAAIAAVLALLTIIELGLMLMKRFNL